jgi:hypothetical protein
LSGPVTIGEIREHLAEVHRMEGHRHPEMIDARTATPSFHPSDLTKLASSGRHVFADTRLAPRAVVVNNVIHFGMARVFSAIAASWVSLSVFDDVETAEAWLEQFRGRES